LVGAAKEARQRAHCPYSKFAVGAALLTEDGNIVQGANVENASYGLTICGERSAICAAVVQGHRHFRSVGDVKLNLLAWAKFKIELSFVYGSTLLGYCSYPLFTI
jgi:homotetrameric cytidine deaminase